MTLTRHEFLAGQNWCSRRVKTLVFSNKHPRISLVLSSQHQGYLSPLKLRVLTIDMLSLRDLARQRIVFAGLEGTPFGQEVFLDGVSVLLSGWDSSSRAPKTFCRSQCYDTRSAPIRYICTRPKPRRIRTEGVGYLSPIAATGKAQ